MALYWAMVAAPVIVKAVFVMLDWTDAGMLENSAAVKEAVVSVTE